MGPTRYNDELHLHSGKGSNWGAGVEITVLESDDCTLAEYEEGDSEYMQYRMDPLPLDFPLSSDPDFYPPRTYSDCSVFG